MCFLFCSTACHAPVLDEFDHLLSLTLTTLQAVHCCQLTRNYGNAKNRTRGCWVRSAIAPNVLCIIKYQPQYVLLNV